MARDKSPGSFDAPSPRLGLAQDDRFKKFFLTGNSRNGRCSQIAIFS
jgi:hypothetical protein